MAIKALVLLEIEREGGGQGLGFQNGKSLIIQASITKIERMFAQCLLSFPQDFHRLFWAWNGKASSDSAIGISREKFKKSVCLSGFPSCNQSCAGCGISCQFRIFQSFPQSFPQVFQQFLLKNG